ncbi:MAG: hypothetical protein LJE92_01345 [Gammaproteobacteria bacterium]|jgi:hypothetical protein|nr:hypothetical protein [Gammaproteobacteria bacterium]
MSKNLRYMILLLILLFVAVNEAVIKMRSTSWERPLRVHIYAISGDARAASEAWVDALTTEHFKPIETFMSREAKRYGVAIQPVRVEYHGRLESHPPQPPSGSSVLENIGWSLRFRAWAWYRGWTTDNDHSDVELFVSYYDTATSTSLRHSVGLEGGLIGIINAFADKTYRGSNQVVIIHELMHTLGATDKYGQANMPEYPRGYAEPYRIPLYPQRMAEIMGGRIPLSAQLSKMPENPGEVVVGAYTAAEINWPVEGR